MRNRKWVFVAVAWATSLVGVGLWAQETKRAPEVVVKPGQPYGEVFTGADIGFQRVAGTPDHEGRIPGRWLVKVNGQWVETMLAFRMVRTE